MALSKRGKYWYGTQQADIRKEIERFSSRSYLATHFADAQCHRCKANPFVLLYDANEGCAARICDAGEAVHPIGDSADYLDDADLTRAVCRCGGEAFEIIVGVALYEESVCIRWVYAGGRCPKCKLTGVYADWKNEHPNYGDYLSRV